MYVYQVVNPSPLLSIVPHIGHLYSSVIADTLKRYYALKGVDAYLCTGTDEHGLKVRYQSSHLSSFFFVLSLCLFPF